jgi:hypothetical protein
VPTSQEVVSDLHFMARRMRLRRWEREPFLTDMLEEVCLSGDMRHQSTTKLHRKQLVIAFVLMVGTGCSAFLMPLIG